MQPLLHVIRETFQATPVGHDEVLAPLLPLNFRIGNLIGRCHGVTGHVAESRLGDKILANFVQFLKLYQG